MDFIDYMLIYFKGEKHLGFFMIGLGVAVLIFAGYLWQVHRGGAGIRNDYSAADIRPGRYWRRQRFGLSDA